MAYHVNPGDSIECTRCQVAMRKSIFHAFIKLQSLSGEEISFFKYKTKKRAFAKIIEEINPKECIICATSILHLNDGLEADVIEIYTKKKVSFSHSSNFSSTHGIQWNNINDFTYAKIVIPWNFVTQRQIAV